MEQNMHWADAALWHCLSRWRYNAVGAKLVMAELAKVTYVA